MGAFVRIKSVAGFMILLIGLGTGCASRPEVHEASEQALPELPISSQIEVREFGLGAGDELEITVYQHPDLTRKIRIPGSGIIFFPLVGEIKVGGVSVTELRRTLTDQLKRYVVDPQVNVEVTTLRSQKVYVLGEVNAPSVFTLESPIRATEAVSKAGGFTINARQTSVLLIRGEMLKPEIRRLDLKNFLKKGEGSENTLLQPGDIIYVPRTFVANVDRFFNHILTALLPVLVLEQGIALYPQVQDTLTGKADRARTTNIVITAPTP